MYEEKIDPEIISLKYKMQDLVHNYFKNNKKLDYLEYKLVTDIDQIESLNYEVNILKEILKQLQKLNKETCKRCQYKILQNIKNIRSYTPSMPGHIHRKVAGRKNVKLLLNHKKSISPEMKEFDTNENIGDISSISRDGERISYYSISNKNLVPKKRKKLNKTENISSNNNNINNNKYNFSTVNRNKDSSISKNKNKRIFVNKGLTPNKQLVKKRNYNIINKDKYKTISRTGNVSDNEFIEKKIIRKSNNKKPLTSNNRTNFKKNINIKNKINNKLDNRNKSLNKSDLSENGNKKYDKFKNQRKNLTTNNLLKSKEKHNKINNNNNIKKKININNNVNRNDKDKDNGRKMESNISNEYLEDYHVIGDYIPRFPDENEVEDDDYFYYDDEKYHNKKNEKNEENKRDDFKEIKVTKIKNLESYNKEMNSKEDRNIDIKNNDNDNYNDNNIIKNNAEGKKV